MAEIETKRLRLLRLVTDDAEALFRTFGDPDTMRFWLDAPDDSIDDTRQRILNIEDHWQTHGFGDFGVLEKSSEKLMGLAGLHHIAGMDDVNIGYAFEKQYWRRGFGLEACRAVLEFGEKALCLSHVVAVIWPENVASIRLIKRCGLRYSERTVWGGGARVVYRMDFSGSSSES